MRVSIVSKQKTYEFEADEVKYSRINKVIEIGKRYINAYVLFFIHNVVKVQYNRKFKCLSNAVVIHLNDDYCDNAEQIMRLNKILYLKSDDLKK